MQALVEQGRSVLLSAFTNAALDNMLRRILQTGETRVLRVGRPDVVHPEVAPYILRAPSNGTTSAALAIRKHVRTKSSLSACLGHISPERRCCCTCSCSFAQSRSLQPQAERNKLWRSHARMLPHVPSVAGSGCACGRGYLLECSSGPFAAQPAFRRLYPG